ncbi:unnamed protein product [Sphagnum troendelagicum]|uniref:Uncharacterized protein n=1 Tax=Sphagnum troendelagicum TaxID=128251 RepID=A0ABP0TIL4_9BRYO
MVGMFMNRSFKVVDVFVGNSLIHMCVHDQIIVSGWDSNVFVESSLVDIIPDVGVLRRLGNQCSTIYHFQMWSFEMWVRPEGTLELFQKMQHKRVQSNYVTICGMLHTCLHSYA